MPAEARLLAVAVEEDEAKLRQRDGEGDAGEPRPAPEVEDPEGIAGRRRAVTSLRGEEAKRRRDGERVEQVTSHPIEPGRLRDEVVGTVPAAKLGEEGEEALLGGRQKAETELGHPGRERLRLLARLHRAR